jgi:Fe2+ transport system protein FeoA
MVTARPESSRTVQDLVAGDSAVLIGARVAPAQRQRLAELGLRPGETLVLMQRAVGGARVLGVQGSRIAVDARIAGCLDVGPAS